MTAVQAGDHCLTEDGNLGATIDIGSGEEPASRDRPIANVEVFGGDTVDAGSPIVVLALYLTADVKDRCDEFDGRYFRANGFEVIPRRCRQRTGLAEGPVFLAGSGHDDQHVRSNRIECP